MAPTKYARLTIFFLVLTSVSWAGPPPPLQDRLSESFEVDVGVVFAGHLKLELDSASTGQDAQFAVAASSFRFGSPPQLTSAVYNGLGQQVSADSNLGSLVNIGLFAQAFGVVGGGGSGTGRSASKGFDTFANIFLLVQDEDERAEIIELTIEFLNVVRARTEAVSRGRSAEDLTMSSGDNYNSTAAEADDQNLSIIDYEYGPGTEATRARENLEDPVNSAGTFNSGASVVDYGFELSFGKQKTPLLPKQLIIWASNGSAGDDNLNSSIQGRLRLSDTQLGDQFQINDTTPGSQINPAAAVTSNGDFVVVWASDSSPGNDPFSSVQARLFNADGSPKGLQFQVNQKTDDFQFTPDVAVDGDGNFYVVWEDFDRTDSDIYLRGFAPDGTPLGDEIIVNQNGRGDLNQPQVAVEDDVLVVAWIDANKIMMRGGFRRIFGNGFEGDP